MGTKKCGKCEIEKPLDNFSNRKRSKDGKVSWCKECFKQYRKENKDKISQRDKLYYEKNKEKILARATEYRNENEKEIKERKKREYEKNREKYLKRSREYYYENREEILEQMKLYYDENKDRIAEYKREYSKRNKKRIAEKARLYLKNNPEKFRERNARRKALIRKNTVGKVDYEEILKRDGMFCHICQSPIEDGNYHFDHVIPLSKGGEHSMENIKIAHARCNLAKRDKMPEELFR